MRQSQNAPEGMKDGVLLVVIDILKHPGGFQENGFGNEDGVLGEECLRPLGLGRIVFRDQADENISIDRVHGDP